MAAAVTGRELAIGLPLSLVAGLVVGAIGTFKHQVGVSAATGEGAPVGLVLSLAMVLVFLLALRIAFPTRWYAVAAAVGVVAAAALLLLPGASGGSTVVLLNAAGLGWTIGVPVVALVVVVWPRRRRSRRTAPGGGGILGPGPNEEDD
ncbi:hypothetical protein [Amnibacterium kyonggiense]|uniref:Uncharacterized protein n=1 Tax=Amnibacterium kyonggiense TaxID=595671 RepID=A0A4R7FIJ0_9MICO|nr:hypothetical protein [Amnibacterium kyonggiense]TDS75991.1 hypothetical protein CLV52_3106 [Amnibacterium kyonggiense]